MNSPARTAGSLTHEVFNQPAPPTGYNLYLTDKTLVRALQREGAAWAEPQIAELGRLLGTEELQRWGFDANENKPVLHTHDQSGNRRDEVLFHPSWHNLMRTSVEHRVHSLPWIEKKQGAHLARAALLMLTAQNEAGHTCPISMTFSGLAALRAEPHKWFCSAPMCDAFLILAQAPKGLSCFFLPRWTPTGERNRFHIQRLKDKLGNRSNASSEVEFHGAWAQLVGEEGRGINTIIEMVHHTRLDCAIAAAALMRQALVQAVHHAGHRKVFGKLLIEQPLMRNVLADLTLESEAATLLMVRLARAFDARESDERERAFGRIATAISKYWLCKRSPMHVSEALECLGGNGYVEESIMPRLYREAPLYSIWEGSGNVICLDILRALAKDPSTLEALMHELRLVAGADPRIDGCVRELETSLSQHATRSAANGGGNAEGQARRLAERAAVTLQASLMVRHSSSAAANAFISSRLGGEGGNAFGTLPSGADVQSILDPVCQPVLAL